MKNRNFSGRPPVFTVLQSLNTFLLHEISYSSLPPLWVASNLILASSLEKKKKGKAFYKSLKSSKRSDYNLVKSI